MTLEEHPRKELFLAAYDAYADRIYRFARMRVASHEDALDLTQETFVRYWNYLQENASVTNERALLFTIVRRLVIDWYRSKKTLSLDQMQAASGFDPEDTTLVSPEKHAAGLEALALINTLPDKYRSVLHLTFVEGYGPKDIAELLHLSANVVSVRLSRGIEKLRAHLSRKRS
jgi:RNA polymerase sigma-70 factor (ECF subfamily)